MSELSRPLVLPTRTSSSYSPDFQCDCACDSAIAVNARSAEQEPNETLYLCDGFHTERIRDGFYIAHATQATPTVMNHAALQVAEFFQGGRSYSEVPGYWLEIWGRNIVSETVSGLVNLNFLELTQDIEQRESSYVSETLSAWLHLTDRCNLRCAYCYLPHAQKDMSFEVGQEAVNAIVRSAIQHGYSTIKLKYAGGEPLLRLPLIVKLHEYALKSTEKHGLGLDAVILSNGTMLTAPIVDVIKSLGVRLMISLDGLDEAHDKQRFYVGGRGSFTDVVTGIENALSIGLVPEISVTVTGRNASKLATLLKWLQERELPFGLNFYRENELSASCTSLLLDEESIIKGMLSAYSIIENQLPSFSLLGALTDRANLALPHVRPCGVGQSYLVFDCQGQISQCQMQMDHPVTDMWTIDPVASIQSNSDGIQNISVENKEGCQLCEWRFWCAGGCPLAAFQTTGRYDVKSPNCNIYKALFPAAIRLEGLRILQDFDMNANTASFWESP